MKNLTGIEIIALSNNNSLVIKKECDYPLGENHYGRCYLSLINDLEKKGEIKPGQRLYDFTSGSAGIALSAVCKAKGYQAVVAMPAGGEKAREKAILDLGAELHLTDEIRYVEGAPMFNLRFLAKNRDCHFLCHMMDKNPEGNPVPKESALSAIGEAMTEVGQSLQGKIDHFVAVSGNGTTQYGYGRVLRKIYPDIKIWGHESLESSFMFEKKYPDRLEKELGINKDQFLKFSRHRLPGSSYRVTWPVPSLDASLPQSSGQFLVYDQKAAREFLQITGHALPKKDYLVRWDTPCPPEIEKFGRTTLTSFRVVESLANKYKNQIFLIVAYDKANRYDDYI